MNTNRKRQERDALRVSALEYPYLVVRGLTVWKSRDQAICGSAWDGGARDLHCCVIDERTGEIVYEPGRRSTKGRARPSKKRQRE